MHWQKYINFYNKLFFPSQQTKPSFSPVLMSKLLGMDLPKWLTDYCTNFWPLSVIKNGKKCTQKTKLHLLFGSKHSVKESEILLTQIFSTISMSELLFEISSLLMPRVQNRPSIGKMWHLALGFLIFLLKVMYYILIFFKYHI